MMNRIRKTYFAAKYLAKYKQSGCTMTLFIRMLFTAIRSRKSISYQLSNDFSLSDYEKNEAICYILMHELNEVANELEKDYFDNEVFYNKYGSSRYDTSLSKKRERTWMHTRRYHMGEGCWINAGVHFLRQHKEGTGTLSIGEKCIFAGNNIIDYTGGLIIGNGVVMNNGVEILTHGHQYIGERTDYFEQDTHGYPSPLIIDDNVVIGAGAIVLANVKKIGQNSIISAGTIVNRPVPPNTMVTPQGMKQIPNGLRTLYMYQ